ncbi:MAG: methyltransferase domain-containing protein [Synergistaceae bacterium]|nr:methyltransferase domain-containing protein [Synergistaceae bacterium]
MFGELKIYQPDEGAGPRVSVDTILLADFARFPARSRVIELGCAQGAVALILARRRKINSQAGRGARFPVIDAVDINPDLIVLAKKNAELNGLSSDVSFFVSDLRECRRDFKAESYDAVIMNPPYDEPGRSRPSPNGAMADAMHGWSCTLAEVTASAKYLLKNRGKFFLVMRAKRTGELFTLLDANNVRPKRMRAVHPKPDRDASVVLIEAARASGDGLTIEPPLFIHGPDGKYTAELLEAYNLGGGGAEKCRS